MKKILFFIIIIICIYFIYQVNNNRLDYMDIGDSSSLGINSYGNKTYGYNDYIKNYLETNNFLNSYNNIFSKSKYRISELNNDIINNKDVIYNNRTYNIRKSLRETDLLTIFIGMDEVIDLINRNNTSEIDNLINNMDNLIKNIKLYCKNKIILIGYYNPYDNIDLYKLFSYISDKYIEIAKKYNIIYVDINNIVSNDKTILPNKNDYHLTSKGYLKISNRVIKFI